MGKNLYELFEKSIHEDFHLQGDGISWEIKNGEPTIFHSPNSKSIGYSLDGPREEVFPFLSLKPSKHIAKMCDAIIVVSYEECDYIFLIEKKKNKKGYYGKQIINGKYFCECMINLFKEHGHYNGAFMFIKFLWIIPRAQGNREPTTHRDILRDESCKHRVYGPLIYLLPYIKAYKKNKK